MDIKLTTKWNMSVDKSESQDNNNYLMNNSAQKSGEQMMMKNLDLQDNQIIYLSVEDKQKSSEIAKCCYKIDQQTENKRNRVTGLLDKEIQNWKNNVKLEKLTEETQTMKKYKDMGREQTKDRVETTNYMNSIENKKIRDENTQRFYEGRSNILRENGEKRWKIRLSHELGQLRHEFYGQNKKKKFLNRQEQNAKHTQMKLNNMQNNFKEENYVKEERILSLQNKAEFLKNYKLRYEKFSMDQITKIGDIFEPGTNIVNMKKLNPYVDDKEVARINKSEIENIFMNESIVGKKSNLDVMNTLRERKGVSVSNMTKSQNFQSTFSINGSKPLKKINRTNSLYLKDFPVFQNKAKKTGNFFKISTEKPQTKLKMNSFRERICYTKRERENLEILNQNQGNSKLIKAIVTGVNNSNRRFFQLGRIREPQMIHDDAQE